VFEFVCVYDALKILGASKYETHVAYDGDV